MQLSVTKIYKFAFNKLFKGTGYVIWLAYWIPTPNWTVSILSLQPTLSINGNCTDRNSKEAKM